MDGMEHTKVLLKSPRSGLSLWQTRVKPPLLFLFFLFVHLFVCLFSLRNFQGELGLWKRKASRCEHPKCSGKALESPALMCKARVH